jgi:hypothetical protein
MPPPDYRGLDRSLPRAVGGRSTLRHCKSQPRGRCGISSQLRECPDETGIIKVFNRERGYGYETYELIEEAPPVKNSLEFLCAVNQNPNLPLPTRMRAAIASLPFEQPKLMVTAHLDGQGLAAQLEQGLARLKNDVVIEHQSDQFPEPLPAQGIGRRY